MKNQIGGPVDERGRPRIDRRGTIACDLVESNPVVWRDRLLRFDTFRARHAGNPLGDDTLRFVDVASGEALAPFGRGYHFGCAFAAGDRMIVTASRPERVAIDIFESTDLEHWECRPALTAVRYRYFNTSITRDDQGYTLMFEISTPPEECGVPFTARFAQSTDLERWELTPPECHYAKDRYTAPHCLRWLDGWYYNFYLEQCDGFVQRVARSQDLARWRTSPLDPVMAPHPDDRRIANPALTAAERRRIATAEDINNSDIDFIEWQGGLEITYSWGNQRGVEFLAAARYDGSLQQFLEGWFAV